MNIKQLKNAIANLPDEMPVAIYVSCGEETAIASSVKVINGHKKAPYDKGDNPFALGLVDENAKVAYIFG